MTMFSELKTWVNSGTEVFKASYKENFYAFDLNINFVEIKEDGSVGHVEFCDRLRASQMSAKYLNNIIEIGKKEGYQEISFDLCPEVRESFHDEWDGADFEREGFEIKL